MNLSSHTFRTGYIIATLLALAGLVICIVGLVIGDEWVLPWHVIPTYVKTPLFIEYFKAGEQAIGLMPDQVLVWQHYATGNYQYLTWPDYTLFGTFLISLVVISVVLTYLSRFWYLLCAGLMLFFLMQLNLGELGFMPESISYVVLFAFAGTTYFFQSIKPDLSLFTRTISILLIYALITVIIGQFSLVQSPVSATISFGLFTPLLIVALLLLFIGGDTMQTLFTIATKNAPNGKNGLIHFMSIGIIYITVLALLFLEKTGQLTLDLWVINPYIVLILSLICGYLALDAKLAVVEAPLPEVLIKKWLYPVLAALSLALAAYAELSGNDSLGESLQMAVLATHLAGAAVFYLYAFMNFTPTLLANQQVQNFFKGERAPLLTGRALYLVFIAGVFFYLNYTPYYQARAGRYSALGALGQKLNSELLASQYYKQAVFYDYYNFKANYALARIENRTGNGAEVIEKLTSATERDPKAKAGIALSNYYSGQNQLFGKILSLKQVQQPNEKVTNNLGIAHFEFQQYDSAGMAFDRSLSLKSTNEVLANQLALQYHSAQSEGATYDAEGTRALINQQALHNKMGIEGNTELPMAGDTFLLQDNLFQLYNTSLNGATENNTQVLSTLEYYLGNTRNSDLKDFLLLGHALRSYKVGNVNQAFRDLAELSVLYSNNRGQYAYMMALWAAQQGAMIDAGVYLTEALTAGYAPELTAALRQAIVNNAIPRMPHPMNIGEEALEAMPGNSTPEKLLSLADQNAFNVPLTLGIISELKKQEVEASDIYEVLRQAAVVNRYDLALRNAFAHQAVESGLAAFGKNALEELRGYVPEEELEQALKAFEEKLEAWRNRVPE